MMSIAASADTAPKRVVSMNLCTDQLAMILESPGQLHSVSYLAADPRSSAMAEKAQNYVVNHGLAEEIYLMQPDLVIAGSFSTRATVAMLKRLGIPVAVIEPAYSLDQVRQRIREIGRILGQGAFAEAVIADFDGKLARLRSVSDQRPSAVLYYANGYTSGDRTLAGEILDAAGFDNAAVKAGFAAGGILPLELLAMLEPDAVITGRRYPAASRSEEILDHPVVQEIRAGRGQGTITDSDWVCGTPYVLRAIEGLRPLREEMEVE
ncbi:MAG: ABC transporter substrate-binding protein [Pseudomonadota bacterium]